MKASELIKLLQELMAESKDDPEVVINLEFGGMRGYDSIYDAYLYDGRIHVEV